MSLVGKVNAIVTSGARTIGLAAVGKVGLAILLSSFKGREALRRVFSADSLRSEFRFAAFLGLFSVLSKLVRLLLALARRRVGKRRRAALKSNEYTAKKDREQKKEQEKEQKGLLDEFDRLNAWQDSLLAGAVASLALLVDGDASRRRTIAVYFFVQGIVKLCMDAAERGLVESWRHGDVALFAYGSAQMMHSYSTAPDAMNPSLRRFLFKMGPIDERAMGIAQALINGTRYPDSLMASFCESYKLAVPPRHTVTDVNCMLLHPRDSSCTRTIVTLFVRRFFQSFLYYAPLTAIRFVSALRAKSAEERRAKLLKWFMLLSQLSAFLASFISLYQLGACTQVNTNVLALAGRYKWALVGAFAGLSLFVAPREQRLDLAIWTLPRGLETAHYFWKRTGLWSGFRYGEVALFAIGASLVFTYWQHKPSLFSPTYCSVLRFLLR
jgi:hypothetical protein